MNCSAQHYQLGYTWPLEPPVGQVAGLESFDYTQWGWWLQALSGQEAKVAANLLNAQACFGQRRSGCRGQQCHCWETLVYSYVFYKKQDRALKKKKKQMGFLWCLLICNIELVSATWILISSFVQYTFLCFTVLLWVEFIVYLSTR